jgi:hypothetical protein
MNKKPKYFLYGKYISKFVSMRVPPKKSDQLFDLYNNFKKITLNNIISIPGYGYWLDKQNIKFHGFYIDVNPYAIKKQTKHGEVPFIDGSNWEHYAVTFKEHSAINEILGQKKEWHDTEQYKLMSKRIMKNLPTYGCLTIADVEEHYNKMLKGWDSIKKNGYQIQGFKDANSIYPDDILVSIGSGGDIFLERNGTHRLTLAQYLNLPKISAYVVRMHPDFILKNEYSINNIF